MSGAVTLAFAAALLTFVVTGCNTGQQGPVATPAETSTGAGVAETTLVAGFPADVPVYRSARLKSSLKNLSEGEQYVANLLSTDRPEAVYEWYASRIPAAGWEVISQVPVERGAGNIVAEIGDRQLVVSVAPALGGTDLFLTVSKVEH